MSVNLVSQIQEQFAYENERLDGGEWRLKKRTLALLWGRLGKGFNTLDSLEAIKTLMGLDYLTAHLKHETLAQTVQSS